jgi:preprotein translocase subunit SecF
MMEMSDRNLSNFAEFTKKLSVAMKRKQAYQSAIIGERTATTLFTSSVMVFASVLCAVLLYVGATLAW